MTYNGKEVITEDSFPYDTAQVGDYVEASIVMNAMDCLPPACMRLDCAQLGEIFLPGGSEQRKMESDIRYIQVC